MRRKFRCFITASDIKDINQFRLLFQDIDVDVFDVFDMPISDINMLEDDITNKIKHCDFVIALIKEQSPNVFFEIGIAKGLGKPIFLVANNKACIPTNLKNFLYINTSFNDWNLIKKSLSEWLKNTKKQTKKVKKSKDLASVINVVNFKEQVKNIRENGNGQEMEKITQQIFNHLKTQIIYNKYGADKGADFAIWIEELENFIGNPFLVELKYGDLNHNVITEVESKLKNYIFKAEAKVGMLLYLDRDGKRFDSNFKLNPLILRFDLEDFINGVSDQGLSRFILNKRNQMAHGGLE